MTMPNEGIKFWKGAMVGSICTVVTCLVTLIPFCMSGLRGAMKIAETPARVDAMEVSLQKTSERIASVEANQQRQAQDMATGFARLEQLVKGGRVGSPRSLEQN